jgi:hypothetical protein
MFSCILMMLIVDLAFGERAGFNVSFPITGLINALTLFPLIYLWFNGERIREKQGKPQIHEDL